VRTLNLLSDSRYPSTFEEDELRDFTLAHTEFFYTGDDRPYGPYVDILWPLIDQFLSTWRMTKTSDYWASGRAITDALDNASLSAPEWPPRKRAKQKRGSLEQEREDEIPF
jgi:hypothetical protein